MFGKWLIIVDQKCISSDQRWHEFYWKTFRTNISNWCQSIYCVHRLLLGHGRSINLWSLWRWRNRNSRRWSGSIFNCLFYENSTISGRNHVFFHHCKEIRENDEPILTWFWLLISCLSFYHVHQSFDHFYSTSEIFFTHVEVFFVDFDFDFELIDEKTINRIHSISFPIRRTYVGLSYDSNDFLQDKNTSTITMEIHRSYLRSTWFVGRLFSECELPEDDRIS